MSQLSSIKRLGRALYRSWLLRILIALVIILVTSYYALLLPWINRHIAQVYAQQTGNQLTHDKLDVHLWRCQLALTNAKDSQNLWQFSRLDIDLACWQSLRQKALIINQLQLSGLRLNPLQHDNGRWNFEAVLQHIASQSPKSSQPSPDHYPLVIKAINIQDAAIHSNLLALNNMPIQLAPLSITVAELDLRHPQAVAASLQTQLNQQVPIHLQAQLHPLTFSGQLILDAKEIPISWFNSLVKPYVALELVRGSIDTHDQLSLLKGIPQRLVSSGSLSQLKVRPTRMDQDAVKWKNLSWENVDIDLAAHRVHLPLVTLDGLDGQFIVTKDRTTNIQAMIIQPAKTSPSSAVAAPTQNAPSQWQTSLDRLVINNAAVGFYDQSLSPSFSAIVQQFSGAITDITTDPAKTATIHLTGNVDGTAPVVLEGTAKPLLAVPEYQVLFSFKQMDMGAFNPYSAEYAGWRIKKGLMSVDLNYHYANGKILGKNHVVLDHLEFGEKVRGPHLIDIPLRLALAMLTDEKGIAVLDTEISGSPQDPSFNIREVIWRALGNTVKKIITAPFRFLSNLLNTKEDLGYLEFTPGESQLTPTAIEKMNLLNKAVQKRPQMRLSIKGIYDEKADLQALKEEQVKSALQKMGLTAVDLHDRTTAWGPAVTNLFVQRGGVTATLPTPEQQYQWMIEQENVANERFERLAHERAQAVKQYFILQLQAPAANFLLDSDAQCTRKTPCNASRVLFSMEE